jgi:hypothetical protein
MPAPSSNDPGPDTVETPWIEYTPEAFSEQLERLVAEREQRSGTRVLFYGGVREQRQQALGTLTRHATGNVHQFRVPSLLDDHRMQTQNNLRKAFDHAAEERALLYFDRADPLFTHAHEDTPDDPEDKAVPTMAEYFFDRVAAYAGVIVLGLQRRRHVDWARPRVQLVVQFE